MLFGLIPVPSSSLSETTIVKNAVTTCFFSLSRVPCTAKTDILVSVAILNWTIVWSFLLRSKTYWISSLLEEVTSFSFSLMMLKMPYSMCLYSCSNGENPMEACRTLHIAYNRSTSYLSHSWVALRTNLHFQQLIKSFNQTIHLWLVNAGKNRINGQPFI